MAMVFVACAEEEREMSYVLDVAPVIDQHCAGCHAFEFDDPAEQAWDLGPCLGPVGPSSRVAIVPGDTSSSALWDTIRGRGCGSAMPRQFDNGLLDVDPDAVERIGLWIEQGALDN